MSIRSDARALVPTLPKDDDRTTQTCARTPTELRAYASVNNYSDKGTLLLALLENFRPGSLARGFCLCSPLCTGTLGPNPWLLLWPFQSQ